ncbi:hypothetical protein [Deep-sea thermophilic phage D6E]|uniref:tail completion or Neck1 protein n=1 Tax=Deep-sea thermophilic phage D6E TaxID=749413 RepID=UPI0001F390E2|nr:tail completion or Neck1 protein [Deep-sea thermophilic phage D6E]ADE87493.1 hypothetical protein [Deep-sea thermophilic phage D6E]
MKVTIKDTNNIDKITRNLQQLGGKQIKVGLFGKDDSELVMIGAVHEYGAEIPVTPKMRAWFAANGYPLRKETTVIKIPERSWLRSGYDENIDKIAKKIEKMVPDVIEGNVNPRLFMDAIGMEFAGLIQKKMRDLKDPPNSQMTIERKGSDNPLIDTGRLVGSIRHTVE